MTAKYLISLLFQDSIKYVIILLCISIVAHLRDGRPIDSISFSVFLGGIVTAWFLYRITMALAISYYSNIYNLRGLLSDLKANVPSQQIRAAFTLRIIIGDRVGVRYWHHNVKDWVQLWTCWLERHIDHLIWSKALSAYIDHRLIENDTLRDNEFQER